MTPHPALILTFAVALSTPALASDTRQLGAHSHGEGSLSIAVEGSEIALVLEAPGADIVGFEHQATSDADIATVEAAVAILSSPLDLFVLPDAAGCSVVDATIELEAEGAHSEFHATYRLGCDDISAIDSIGFAYFAEFPQAEELDVQVVSDKGATGFEVTREARELDMRGGI
jgi:hypothetical protein